MSVITRRTMLKSAATAAALAAIPRPANANDRITVGVLGCRTRGHQVASTMIQSKQFAVKTLCDCDDAMFERAMQEAGKVFGDTPPDHVKDFRKVLDDPDIDAVVVATPDHWHALMTIMALDAGKHVYCEKPASFNIADGKAMVAASGKHPDLTVQVGTQQRSGQHFMDAKQFIAEGGLGTVGFCRGSFVTDRHLVPRIPNAEPPAGLDYDLWCGPAPMRPYNKELLHYNWHFLYDYGTGDMGNWGAHWLDVMRMLLDLDLPTYVSGTGGPDMVDDAKEFPDTQTVLYQFPQLTMLWELRHWSRFAPGGGKGNCCEIVGDEGSMLIDRRGWVFEPKKGDAERHDASPLEGPHVLNFAEAIRGQAQPTTPMVEGHKSAVLCHLGNIVGRLNRGVKFDPATESVVGDAEGEALMDRPYRAPWKREV